MGGVRCYWALLSPRYPNKDNPDSKFELVFVHPDPVLAVHLSSQRLSMMGRGVLEFIHPVEREREFLVVLVRMVNADSQVRGLISKMPFH